MAAKRKVLQVDINRKAYERLRHCNDLFAITPGDLKGPVLTRLAQVHRTQEKRIFASEGREGGRGSWPPLSPAYAIHKRKKVGTKPILVWSGDMKERFIKPSRREYIERALIREKKGKVERVVFQFGARSVIATYHFRGFTGTRTSSKGLVFSWRLPRRDMVTKSSKQIAAMRQAVIDWYQKERLPQVESACKSQLAQVSKP